MMQWLNKWQPYVLNALLFDKFIFELAKMFRSFIEECIICTVLNSLGTIHRTWGWWDKIVLFIGFSSIEINMDYRGE